MRSRSRCLCLSLCVWAGSTGMSQMRVYNAGVLDDLVEHAATEKRKSDAIRSASQMTEGEREKTMEEKMAERERWRRDMRAEEYKSRMEKLQKDVTNRLHREVEMRELRSQEMEKAFLAENQQFAAQLFETCDHKDPLRLHKRSPIAPVRMSLDIPTKINFSCSSSP